MAFYFSLDHQDIAGQVATLLNCYNKLGTKKSITEITCGRTNYIVETHGRWVIGAVGLDRQSYTFTEIKHIVVHPDWRGKGIAKHLLKRALDITTTKMGYATIREDNEASLKLFESLGFRNAGDYAAENHRVVLLVRVSPQWEQIKSASKSSWLDAKSTTDDLVRSLLTYVGPGEKAEVDG
jgi:N-acetylglutamate synthase-like GNAT family acetyltransferase